MPEIRQFPQGYNNANRPFSAYVPYYNEVASYRRFIFGTNKGKSLMIPPDTPIFFITRAEADAMLEATRDPQPDWWQPTEQLRDLVNSVFNKVPSPEPNDWYLVVNDSMANLITF